MFSFFLDVEKSKLECGIEVIIKLKLSKNLILCNTLFRTRSLVYNVTFTVETELYMAVCCDLRC